MYTSDVRRLWPMAVHDSRGFIAPNDTSTQRLRFCLVRYCHSRPLSPRLCIRIGENRADPAGVSQGRGSIANFIVHLDSYLYAASVRCIDCFLARYRVRF